MRSGYVDDLDQNAMAMWRGRVASSIRGKRGQALLRDCLAALEAMPEKQLIKEELVDGEGVCLLGAVGRHRGIAGLVNLDPEDHAALAQMFDVAPCLIQEIEDINDRCGPIPEARFMQVQTWVKTHIIAL